MKTILEKIIDFIKSLFTKKEETIKPKEIIEQKKEEVSDNKEEKVSSFIVSKNVQELYGLMKKDEIKNKSSRMKVLQVIINNSAETNNMDKLNDLIKNSNLNKKEMEKIQESLVEHEKYEDLVEMINKFYDKKDDKKPRDMKKDSHHRLNRKSETFEKNRKKIDKNRKKERKFKKKQEQITEEE